MSTLIIQSIQSVVIYSPHRRTKTSRQSGSFFPSSFPSSSSPSSLSSYECFVADLASTVGDRYERRCKCVLTYMYVPHVAC